VGHIINIAMSSEHSDTSLSSDGSIILPVPQPQAGHRMALDNINAGRWLPQLDCRRLLEQLPREQFIWSESLLEPDLDAQGVLDLWSGSKRHAKACVDHGAPWVLCYEWMEDCVKQNLLSLQVRSFIEECAHAGCFRAFGGGPVCSSMSRARWTFNGRLFVATGNFKQMLQICGIVMAPLIARYASTGHSENLP